ncbi:MAG: hypothetical protein U0235_26730 [Polyangiaceae bacterium]
MLRLSVAAVGLAIALAACGASSTTDTFPSADAGSSESVSDAANGGSTAVDAALPPNPRTVDAATGANRCDRLLADVDRLRAEAMTCSLTVLDPQCNQLVDDVCCKLVVSNSTMTVAKFEVAVRAFKDAKCTIDCKAVTCPDAPTKLCQPMSGGKGSCSQ